MNNNDSFYTNDSRYIYFTLNITEDNFDEVVLSYNDSRRGRVKEKRLCNRIKDGVCEKKFRYRDYYDNLTLIIRDEAGNSWTEEIN